MATWPAQQCSQQGTVYSACSAWYEKAQASAAAGLPCPLVTASPCLVSLPKPVSPVRWRFYCGQGHSGRVASSHESFAPTRAAPGVGHTQARRCLICQECRLLPPPQLTRHLPSGLAHDSLAVPGEQHEAPIGHLSVLFPLKRREEFWSCILCLRAALDLCQGNRGAVPFGFEAAPTPLNWE